jgi:hypothetical protein
VFIKCKSKFFKKIKIGEIYMSKKKKPLLTDEFLDELANEINELYGRPDEQNEDKNNHTEDD